VKLPNVSVLICVMEGDCLRQRLKLLSACVKIIQRPFVLSTRRSYDICMVPLSSGICHGVVFTCNSYEAATPALLVACVTL
jgi:hypothetical protein